MQIALPIAGESQTVEVEELEPKSSASTSRPRRVLRWVFGLREDDPLEDQISEELSNARRAEGALVDSEGGEWIVETYSSSFSTSGGGMSYEAVLIEVEHLDVTAVMAEGVTCKVNWYTDDGNDVASKHQDAVLLRAELEVGSEDVAATNRFVWENDGYFDLVRTTPQGDLNPVRARFGGKLRWQEAAGGGRRYLVNFVVPLNDEPEELASASAWDSGPETYNVQMEVLRLGAAHESLLHELHQAGALDEDAVDRARAVREADPENIKVMAFYESIDLDQYR
jgi:hypothetical protein